MKYEDFGKELCRKNFIRPAVRLVSLKTIVGFRFIVGSTEGDLTSVPLENFT